METVWWLSSRVQWLEQGQAQMRSEFCKHLEHFTTEAVLKSMSISIEELHQDVKQSAAHLLSQVRAESETKDNMTHDTCHVIVMLSLVYRFGLSARHRKPHARIVKDFKEQLRKQDVSLGQRPDGERICRSLPQLLGRLELPSPWPGGWAIYGNGLGSRVACFLAAVKGGQLFNRGLVLEILGGQGRHVGFILLSKASS
eukprot:Skav212255  [mRNA]  locus=scaffold499:222744:229413:- [translate_table: standard]